jgi:hypothetical protein
MQSGLQNAYLREIELQCSLIARAASRLDRESEASERDQTEIWMLVQTILTSAGAIAALLWGERCSERSWLRAQLDIEPSSPLERRLHHAGAERFDERAEEWESARADRGFVVFEGRQIGDPDDPEDKVEWFQRYDAATGVVSFWSHSVDLAEIVREVHRMRPFARSIGQL